MVLPIIIAFLMKAITTVYGIRLKLVRTFQDYLSQISMGRFIAHYGNVEPVKAGFEEYTKLGINAYIFIITMPALLSVYGDEIRNTPFLHSYFSTYTSYNKWLNVKEAIGTKTIPVENEVAFQKEIIKLFGLDALANYFDETIGKIWKLTELIIKTIWQAVETMADSPEKVVAFINSNYDTTDFDPWLGCVPPMIWRLVHPTLDLDWTVIKTQISLVQTYAYLRSVEQEQGKILSMMQGQMMELYKGEELLSKQPIDTEGIATFEIPLSKADPILTAKTQGIQSEINPWRSLPIKFHIIESDETIILTDLAWITFDSGGMYQVKISTSDTKGSSNPNPSNQNIHLYLKRRECHLDFFFSHTKHDYTVELLYEDIVLVKANPKNTTGEKMIAKSSIALQIPQWLKDIQENLEIYVHNNGNLFTILQAGYGTEDYPTDKGLSVTLEDMIYQEACDFDYDDWKITLDRNAYGHFIIGFYDGNAYYTLTLKWKGKTLATATGRTWPHGQYKIIGQWEVS